MDRYVYLFDYVKQPYEAVRVLLRDQPASVFEPAAQEADGRRRELCATLGVELAGIDVTKAVDLEVSDFVEKDKPWPIAKVHVSWRASRLPAAFPSMEADLEAYALSAEETQVSFLGRYRPPLGPLGGVVDAVVLHRVAEASLHRFFDEVVRNIQMLQPV